MTTKHWDWVTIPGSTTVEVHTALYGGIEDLPEPQEGVIYIVSKMVHDMSTRQDIIYPDTGPSALRDEQGMIVSVCRFLR